ncbi:N-6 DNA methylase [Subsaximicrobium wynnwilliamsii]|uniref:site-specific DNA-methyltransferase (adenine-specific) n=1 Tax=Subsaximicrobium wynnwilliamsii TaxID=291179 RepID=A0A5C6ZJH6_9FLAO|nr:Eco57I restriction-modification methylase domain-containing protein [Subsaximicrobium wynnwilliamsii]TXD84288.1 N-6 DNA methylase [Subsaximicrobium wynnwilliamsii]TXD89909.1 N-6 DNA methylase [Subsaximicrobium wynnwilliamsii]TXE04000.1 N-6 DNA methylase [Subsaximicrobium wynnwilliamsii]
MALFQASVLKSHLALLDQSAVDRAYKKYQNYFWNANIQDNIKSAKEEQYQASFLHELFVNILGYTLFPNPDSNLTTEFKNEKNSRKADAAILKDGVAIGVIELKGTITKDLESIRLQAFDYKANQKGCVYVITSNFEKLRFYINDATEFEEFDLFTLSQNRFKLLYLCLHIDKLLNNTALKIKEASIVEEEEITKAFYKDYSVFKRELYRDLVKNNAKTVKAKLIEQERAEDQNDIVQLEKNVKLTLFKKSQKLIDRFLFIFFAEDRTLLPSNSTKQILNKWKHDWDFGDERPLYSLFKQYFLYLDQGRKSTPSRAEIYAYNGGLFKPDAILDALEINNDLLFKHTSKLSNYDFESEVDANILRHIFENALNEIESVNAEIEGGDFDQQTIKRKKDAVFYTPKYITKYIVENTVGKLCVEKKIAIGFKEADYFEVKKGTHQSTKMQLLETLDAYREWLLQLTICDPACSSGAFLNQALDFLIKEHQYIDELKTKVLVGGLQFPDIENTILENNIYGVDFNEESVEITKLSLWLRTAKPRRKLNDLSNNIKCGNSLIDSKTVAGNKAFNWSEEFPQVFKTKDLKAYHITTAVHDSRTSDRMVKYEVRKKRDLGTNPYPNVVYFTDADDLIISQTIAQIVKEDGLRLLAYNICGDHIHLLLVCDIADIPRIMQKIKSVTSKILTREKTQAQGTREHAPLAEETGRETREHAPLAEEEGKTREHAPLAEEEGTREHAPLAEEEGETREHAPLAEEERTREHAPLAEEEGTREHAPLAEETGKKREHAPLAKEKAKKPLWGQKYSVPKEITSTQQLDNTLNYIQKNRSKHELPEHSAQLQTVIDGMLTSKADAFKTEITGGFDVVIGNPPYVRKQGLMEHYPETCVFYEKRYKSATANYDIYALFMERCYDLINRKGIVSFILPHKFLVSDFGAGIRQFFKEKTAVKNLIHFGSEIIFSEASTYNCIIDLTKSRKEKIQFKNLNQKIYLSLLFGTL